MYAPIHTNAEKSKAHSIRASLHARERIRITWRIIEKREMKLQKKDQGMV